MCSVVHEGGWRGDFSPSRSRGAISAVSRAVLFHTVVPSPFCAIAAPVSALQLTSSPVVLAVGYFLARLGEKPQRVRLKDQKLDTDLKQPPGAVGSVH